MNPDNYDLSTSDGCRRALTRALFDAVSEAAAECLAQMQRKAATEAAAVAQLAYGTTTDMFDEYLHVGETTGRECLKNFCKIVVEAFGDAYLRRLTADDCQSLIRMHETVHDFLGMLGSIDYMHWQWKNCPTAWRGQFTSGYKGSHPFSPARRPIFVDPRLPLARLPSFSIMRRAVCLGASADGSLISIQTLTEGAFGVLRSRWTIVKGPARFWFKEVIADVMYACIIMHNMIVEQEVGHVTDWVDDEAGSSSSTTTPPVTRGLPLGFGEVLQQQTSMRSQQDHTQLMTDMIEEVWNRNRR
ncbi:uncharacterized protein LOC125194837 [Salvia hispanica]|uniref:uncharacterized protein LOC125194837 n=1 Tax=Salvia hispanica TaxID=49212 RepID=UPI0020092254|nr:uncharacterized protein LOC125194837 [Salvia hispanica]